MKKIMNEKLTITTSNPVRARFYEYHVSRIRGIFIVSMKLFMWRRERGIVWWVTALSPIQKVI